MGKDILFKTEDFVFSYRVGGLLIVNDRILLQKPKHEEDYYIIGGHVSSLETTTEALKREFEEELHTKVEVDRLLAVGEVFFPWGQRPCHQICFYYKIRLLKDDIPLEGSFSGYDELEDERFELDFCWVPLDELRRGRKVYPLELIPHILKDDDRIVHFISKDI